MENDKLYFERDAKLNIEEKLKSESGVQMIGELLPKKRSKFVPTKDANLSGVQKHLSTIKLLRVSKTMKQISM